MNKADKDTKPTRKEREYNRHHKEILVIAEALFAENGYHQTAMQMIADRAEFSVGYLYKHFSGKEEMYREMIQFHLRRLDEIIVEISALQLRPLEEMRRIFVETCSHFNHHRDFMRIFYADIGGEFTELAESKVKHLADIAVRITRAQELGEIKAYDPFVLAAAIQGATKELFGVMAENPGPAPFDKLPDILFELLIEPLRN